MGVELTMTVNHFGHFYLTYLLFPLIKDVENAKIINISSSAHSFVSEDVLTDLNAEESYQTQKRYGLSKKANILFTGLLA